MARAVTICIALWLVVGSTLPAAAQCRIALTLGLDVSSSVDPLEYDLQIEGLAQALEDAEVRFALFQIPGAHVALQVYEWSGPYDQHIIADWMALRTPADADRLAATLRAHSRRFAYNPTALGEALRFGHGQLMRGPACDARKIDISGDGQSNVGIPPQTLYGRIDFGDITVNGLAIESDERALARYYRFFVIWGPDAFVEKAADFSTYGEAIRRKLIRELGVPRIGMR